MTKHVMLAILNSVLDTCDETNLNVANKLKDVAKVLKKVVQDIED